MEAMESKHEAAMLAFDVVKVFWDHFRSEVDVVTRQQLDQMSVRSALKILREMPASSLLIPQHVIDAVPCLRGYIKVLEDYYLGVGYKVEKGERFCFPVPLAPDWMERFMAQLEGVYSISVGHLTIEID